MCSAVPLPQTVRRMSSYKSFASVYDLLTSNIPYLKRGEYFFEILCRRGKSTGILVDLACGTGSLSEVMAGFGYDVIGIDSSYEMLGEAMTKRANSNLPILYLCQDMRDIDLYGTMDVCICALDSVNHLVQPADVQAAFNRVSLFLHPDGLFIFDVNTPYKHEKVLANNTFVYDYDEVYCAWQNTNMGDNSTEICLDLFFKDEDNTYYRETEIFSERAYSHAEILAFLGKANLLLVDFFEADTFNKPTKKSERIVYVAKSTKNMEEEVIANG